MDRISIEGNIKKIAPELDRDMVDNLYHFIDETINEEVEGKVSDIKSSCSDIAYQISSLSEDLVKECD